MRRADRLFEIIQLMRGARRVTARSLAGRLEVSERTIYRDVADLVASGVPIDGEAGFGYVLQDGYDLPPLMFTRDEIAALTAGARLIRAWGGIEMARGAEEALAKIDAILDDALRTRSRQLQVHAFGAQQSDETRAALDLIETAIEARHLIQFTYRDGAGLGTQRCVRPLGMWFWGKFWTFVGWCELRDDFRMFRVDRMTALNEGPAFKPRPGQSLRDFYARPDPGGREFSREREV
ncbi:MAG: YafY family protein [Pseudomonadota bacterium]